MSDLEDFRFDVLDELLDHVSSLNEQLNDDPADEFQSMFRVFHSIKGVANAGGFEEISIVTHVYENLVLLLREGEISYTAEAKDILFAYSDWLSLYLEKLSKNIEHQEDCTDIQYKVNHFISMLEEGTPDSEELSVLVVEDEEDIIDIIEEHLVETFKCSVDRCLDGKSGEEFALKKKYDVIFLDNFLPYQKGIHLLEKLRQSDSINRDVPVIFVTGHMPIISGKEKPFLDNVVFVRKPFKLNSLSFYMRASNAWNFRRTG